jgi:recombination protein RecR
MEGVGPEKLNIPLLKNRINHLKIKEIVVALDSTIEGDATSLYLKQELEPLGVEISRLAFGLPIGSTLDFVDGGTLARAFSGRTAC